MSSAGGQSARGMLPHLGRLFQRGSVTGFSEAQLLEEFIARRDEAAFEAIVKRHGPMVLTVCRQILRDPNDIEDAFQATFVVLVRRASSLQRQESLGSWLYGVAYRVAIRARAQAAQRQGRLDEGVPLEEVGEKRAGTNGLELDTILRLHEELNRLPEKYRLPIVLCYLEGLTHEEAAERLGWPLGSVKGRLSRARDLLRPRLVRRGVGLSAAALLAALEETAHAVVVPQLLSVKTVRAAMAISSTSLRIAATTSAISASVSLLAQGVIRTMVFTRVGALALSALIGAGVIFTGASVVAVQATGISGAQRLTPQASEKDKNPKAKAARTTKQVENTAQPKPVAAAIDIMRQLDQPFSCDYSTPTPLEVFLKDVRRANGPPIYVDPIGLQGVEKTLLSPVTAKLERVPLKTALRILLGQVGLVYLPDDGFIWISSLRRSSIQATIRDVKSPEMLKLVKTLETAVPFKFPEKTPLEDALKQIQEATKENDYNGVQFYVDPQGLQDAKQTLRSTVSGHFGISKVLLKDSLHLLLEPLGLGYCIQNGVVMISSPRAIAANFDATRTEQSLPELVPAKPATESD